LKIWDLLLKVWYLITYRFRRARVKVTQARLSGDGSFIDIRYLLSRPDQAQGVFPVYLIDKSTGERLELMRLAKFGAIRTKHNKYTNNGVLLFYNRQNIIKSRSRTTLYFGSLVVNDIEVI